MDHRLCHFGPNLGKVLPKKVGYCFVAAQMYLLFLLD